MDEQNTDKLQGMDYEIESVKTILNQNEGEYPDEDGPGGDEEQNIDSPDESNNNEVPAKDQDEDEKDDTPHTEEEDDDPKKSAESEHDGKYFVIQKGMCQCDQGFKFPKFKVTSHQKHYWNDADGNADYLAVTEDDLTLDPPAMPFGQCKLQPTSSGYLPCSYAPVGKWQKPYEKVKVMGHSCLTEISELQCAIGGKITIMKHGQQSEAGKSNVAKADAKEQHIYNPIVDFEEFSEEIVGNDAEAW